ncbi:MAG: hypothetical protein HY744_26150 [Deltaproteobacteria bacterium]|nr:hypothetical protein [Deltaproteobacteria bacterium]
MDGAFRELLAAYEDAGKSVFAWALANPSRSGPRCVAFRTPRGEARLAAIDGRRVKAAGRLDPSSGTVELLTCYRVDRNRPLKSHWLELCRERAGHKRIGTAIEIGLA